MHKVLIIMLVFFITLICCNEGNPIAPQSANINPEKSDSTKTIKPDAKDSSVKANSMPATKISPKKKNERLLACDITKQEWSSDEINAKKNREWKNPEVISTNWSGNNLTITLEGTIGLASYSGDINLKSDTLELYFFSDKPRSMASSLAKYKLIYQVAAPEKKAYKIEVIAL